MFVQVTVSPTLIVIGFGEKAKFTMSAFTVLAARAVAAVSRKSTINSAGMSERLSVGLDQRRCVSIAPSHTAEPQAPNWRAGSVSARQPTASSCHRTLLCVPGVSLIHRLLHGEPLS